MLKNNGFHNRHSPFSRSFSPASFFANGEQGWWFDPSNSATLFQDAAGTTPVTAVEQPVGLQLDLSKGLVLGSELVTNGDFSGGSTGWSLGVAVVSGGKMSFSAAGLYAELAAQAGIVASGKTYRLTFEVSGLTSGSFNIGFASSYGGTISLGRTISANGTYSWSMPSSGTGLYLISMTAGTTASIDNISVKELPGNHRFQSTSANRPVVSARVNLLTKTEQFDDGYWTKQAGVFTPTTAPSNFTAAGRFTTTSTGANQIRFFRLSVLTGAPSVASIVVRGGSGIGFIHFRLQTASPSGDYGICVNLTTSAITTGYSDGTNPLTSPTSSSANFIGDGWLAVQMVVPTSASASYLVYVSNSASTTELTSPIGSFADFTGADLRPTNQGVGLPVYQRVNTSTDYDSTGFPIYIKPNGSNQFMQTNSINFTATDKMTVWQGVRKLSDAVLFAILAEPANGAFALQATSSVTGTGYRTAQSGAAAATSSGLFVAPITNVFTALFDATQTAAANALSIRINGAAVSPLFAGVSSISNFGNNPVYFYARGGTSIFFNGNDYGSIARGAASTAAQITDGETYINSLTKAYAP
jgi:hypothetical protein